MEVRNVNSAQNFGMALKIKPGAKDVLRVWDENKLARLKQLGEELAGHKHVDVVVEDSGKMILDLRGCANKYSGISIKPSYPSDFVSLEGIWEGSAASGYTPGSKISHVFQFKTPEAAKALIDKTAPKTYYDEIEKMGNIAKAFEERGVWQAEKAAAERARVERVNNAVDDLFGQFGTEA